MRLRDLAVALLAVLLSILAVSCGRGDPADAAVVTFVTPSVPTATPTQPGPTPTPIPPPEMLLSTIQVYQAGAILASITGEVSGGAVTFIDRQYPLTRGSQSMYAFVSVGTEDPPGPHVVRVDFTTKNGSKGTVSAEVTVLKTKWDVDALEFNDEQTSLLDPKVVAAEDALLKQTYSKYTPEKLWDGMGGWRVPVPGAITARFGEQRSINGGPASGHHSGTDIGAEMGTPVVATNRGRVAMARQLQVRGNMVIVDHGGGLLSGYAHMKEFTVTEGQEVQPGDVIGYVGSTGLSTGAHLHWEISANGVLVDAIRFTDGSNGF